MLTQSEVVGFIPTRDADRARAFYEHTLGLDFVSDDPFALVFDAHGTTLRIVRVDALNPAPFTILGWKVADINACVAGLSAAGVVFEQYGLPGQTDDGIWCVPGDAAGSAKVAWFKDPDGNVLSVTQYPAAPTPTA